MKIRTRVANRILAPVASRVSRALLKASNKIAKFAPPAKGPLVTSADNIFHVRTERLTAGMIDQIRKLSVVDVFKLADLIIDNVMIVDSAGKIIFSYHMKDFIVPGTVVSIWDLVPERLKGAAKYLIDHIRKEGQVANIKIRLLALDGTERKMLLSSKAMKNPETGEHLGTINFMLDVTDKEQVESDYEFLFQNAPLPMVRVDYRTVKILRTNNRLLKISGYLRGEVEGKSIEMFMPSDDDLAKILEHFRRRFREKKEQLEPLRVHLKMKNGDVVPVELIARLIPGLGEDFVFIRDLREDIKSWEALRKAERRAMLGNLITSIFHQISGYTANIFTTADALATKHPDIEYARIIARQGQKFRDLIQNALKFAAGVEEERRPINVESEIKFALDFEKPELMERKIELEIDIEGNLPPVSAAPLEIQDIILNLVANARHAIGEKGKVRISARGSDENVVIEISDTGPGIPEDILLHVWEPFFSTKDPGKGTGLGLAIVKDRVDGLGGQIELVSEEGKGSTFTITLPEAKPIIT